MTIQDSISFEQAVADTGIDTIAICPSCSLEHHESTRIVWAFPWGLRLTRCPRCLCQDIDYPDPKQNAPTPIIQHRAGSFSHD